MKEFNCFLPYHLLQSKVIGLNTNVSMCEYVCLCTYKMPLKKKQQQQQNVLHLTIKTNTISYQKKTKKLNKIES